MTDLQAERTRKLFADLAEYLITGILKDGCFVIGNQRFQNGSGDWVGTDPDSGLVFEIAKHWSWFDEARDEADGGAK